VHRFVIYVPLGLAGASPFRAHTSHLPDGAVSLGTEAKATGLEGGVLPLSDIPRHGFLQQRCVMIAIYMRWARKLLYVLGYGVRRARCLFVCSVAARILRSCKISCVSRRKKEMRNLQAIYMLCSSMNGVRFCRLLKDVGYGTNSIGVYESNQNICKKESQF
jgi:hypothetical protein